MKAEETALRELKKLGTQKSLVKKMQTRGELYELLGYNPADGKWKGKSV
jgi:2-methylisocitrate lyase-like PEP mutase family enzyme